MTIQPVSYTHLDVYKRQLFTSPWNIDWATDHNKELKLSEFGNVEF